MWPFLLTIRPPFLETFSKATRLSAFGFRLKGLAFDQPPAPSRSLPRQPTRVRLPRPSCSECAGIGNERMEGVRVDEREGSQQLSSITSTENLPRLRSRLGAAVKKTVNIWKFINWR